MCRAAVPAFLALDLERLVEGAAGGDDAQLLVEHQQRLAHGIHDGLRERISDCREWYEVIDERIRRNGVPPLAGAHTRHPRCHDADSF